MKKKKCGRVRWTWRGSKATWIDERSAETCYWLVMCEGAVDLLVADYPEEDYHRTLITAIEMPPRILGAPLPAQQAWAETAIWKYMRKLWK